MNKAANVTPDRLCVSIREAASMCGCSVSHIYRLVERGELKLRKLGHRSVILVEDIRQVLIQYR